MKVIRNFVLLCMEEIQMIKLSLSKIKLELLRKSTSISKEKLEKKIKKLEAIESYLQDELTSILKDVEQ